jgi:tRNA(Ile)-lysidine synthase
MILRNNITAFIDKHNLIPHGSTLVVGLSGGPDSVFLLHMLHQLQQEKNLTLIAAHLDHGWRPESAQDALWCQNLCTQLCVTYVTQKLTHILPEPSCKEGSLEATGRKARRLFFEHVRTTYNAQAIALAHHADDQQETFLIRLARGASLTGLTGMRPSYGLYIRPLLHLRKNDIVAYLQEHGLTYLKDPSNESDLFLRNRIRKHLLPALKACDARFDANINRTLEQLQETEALVQSLTHETFEQLACRKAYTIQLARSSFLKLHPHLQQRILLLFLRTVGVPHTPSQGMLREMQRFIATDGNGSHQLFTSWRLCKQDDVLELAT